MGVSLDVPSIILHHLPSHLGTVGGARWNIMGKVEHTIAQHTWMGRGVGGCGVKFAVLMIWYLLGEMCIKSQHMDKDLIWFASCFLRLAWKVHLHALRPKGLGGFNLARSSTTTTTGGFVFGCTLGALRGGSEENRGRQ